MMTDAEGQLELIEVGSKKARGILAKARKYGSAMRERKKASEEEIRRKNDLLEAIKKSDLVADKDGAYRFSISGVEISITPRDELIQVKYPDVDTDDD